MNIDAENVSSQPKLKENYGETLPTTSTPRLVETVNPQSNGKNKICLV